MTDYLFAYGSLQPGCAPMYIATVAAKLRPVGTGFVRGALYDLGEYPAAVPDASSKHRIAGTVLQLPEDASFLRQLDDYEGFDPQMPEASEFVRERQSVEMTAGGALECWIYRYNREPNGARVIERGRWRKSSGR
jgi:gamma-glutamylcyclotransferase (GGCT)/AIG2-like uncharacterized protein YtfP